MQLTVFPSTAALAEHVADQIETALSTIDRPIFGWPSGRTTIPVLEALRERRLDMSRATIAMMDDYVWLDGDEARPIDAAAHYSCSTWIRADMLPRLAPGGAPHVIEPQLTDPASYDATLRSLGGVDLFLVGLGSSDGHVAFNPPGTPLNSRTRVVRLADTTREDNLGTFPGFTDLSEVPQGGLTVGLATICDARRVVALAHGPGKAQTVERTLATSEFDPALPATFLHAHPHTELLVSDLGIEL